MATTAEECLRALERALLREEARLRRSRARLAALRRANRRLLAQGFQAQARGQDPIVDAAVHRALHKTLDGLRQAASIVKAAEDLLQPGSTLGLAEAHHRAGPSGGQPACTLQAGPLTLDRETNVALVTAGSPGTALLTPFVAPSGVACRGTGAGKCGERRAALTPSEAGLLTLLMERPGHIWSCRDLARLALGYDVVESEAVEIVRPHISRLRQKLEPDPLQRRLIRTVRGQGYLLSP